MTRIAITCLCLVLRVATGTAFAQNGWVEIYRTSGAPAPSPSPESVPLPSHGPSVWDGLFGTVTTTSFDSENWTCGAGATSRDPDDDVYVHAKYWVDNNFINEMWAWGYEPSVAIGAWVTRDDTPHLLKCEADGSGFNQTAYYTIEPLPTSEITTPTGWAYGETRHNFEMTLTGTGPFSARRVREEDAGGGFDSCWVPNGPYRKLDAVTGGSWPVGAGNVWGVDEVGYGSAMVDYYQDHSSLPCSCLMVQRMWINSHLPSGGEEWHWYKTNELRTGITSNAVWVQRDGVRRERTW